MSRITQLRDSVQRAYSDIAEQPQLTAPFPVGRELALDLGYPAALLSALPAISVEAFCGVSNVSLFANIQPGTTVLDLGCGAGLDALIAARRTKAQGRVIGVDFSASMLERAQVAVTGSGAANVELRRADAESLPLAEASVDVALVNGIFNLNPCRERIMEELTRVVRPGGAVYVAELVLQNALAPEEQTDTNWFS